MDQISVPITVPAKLKPSLKLRMMMKKHFFAIEVDDQSGSRQVTRKTTPEENLWEAITRFKNFLLLLYLRRVMRLVIFDPAASSGRIFFDDKATVAGAPQTCLF